MHILHYKVFGNSGSAVVLLHGFLTSHDYWRGEIIETLSRSHRVVAIDLLGFGKSPMPKESLYDADAHVSALQHTIKHVLGNEPFILVGHSMGAVIAALFAKQHPASVKKLLAVNPPMFKNVAEAKSSIQNTSIFYRLFLYSKIRFLAPFFLRLAIKLINQTPQNKIRNIFVLEKGFRESTHRSRRRSLGAIIEGESFLAVTSEITLPVRVLIGKYDRQEYLKNLYATVLPPHVSAEVLNYGHHIPKKRPDIVIDEITKL